jgi:hypothetical protein
MFIESDEGFVSLIAESDAEAALFPPIVEALNKGKDSGLLASLTDNQEPERPIPNGILQLQI